MDALQIHNKLNSDDLLKDNVWGIFARDELPATLLPGGYIMNNKPRGDPGEHWIALWIGTDRVEFMDSLGRTPHAYKWKTPATYNPNQLQKKDSDTCGAYCLYFLYYRSRNISMQHILEVFSDDCVENDKYVSDFVKML